MKKIGFDARYYFKTGIGVYIQNLLYHFEKLAPSDLTFYVYLMHYDFPKIHFERTNFIKRKVYFPWTFFSSHASFLNTLNKDNLDLMHFTFNLYPTAYRKQFIATIHHLKEATKISKIFKTTSFEFAFRLLYTKMYFDEQVKNSAMIITPTETVKKDIGKVYGSSYEKETVCIPHGINYQLIAASQQLLLHKNKNKVDNFRKKLQRLGVNSNYFIYVGDFMPHKNIDRLILAFSKIRHNVQLILAGPNSNFAKKIIPYIRFNRLTKKILFYPNPKNEDLVLLYKTALGLIHPSFCEGFGLPILEAAYFNCPIIASKIKVFKEVLDSQFVDFNPYNTNDIYQKILYFLIEKPHFDYRKIIAKYSFENSAEKTLRLYQKLLTYKNRKLK